MGPLRTLRDRRTWAEWETVYPWSATGRRQVVAVKVHAQPRADNVPIHLRRFGQEFWAGHPPGQKTSLISYVGWIWAWKEGPPFLVHGSLSMARTEPARQKKRGGPLSVGRCAEAAPLQKIGQRPLELAHQTTNSSTGCQTPKNQLDLDGPALLRIWSLIKRPGKRNCAPRSRRLLGERQSCPRTV